MRPGRGPVVEEGYEAREPRGIRDAVEEGSVEESDELRVGRVPPLKLWRREEVQDRGEEGLVLLNLGKVGLKGMGVRRSAKDADVKRPHDGRERGKAPTKEVYLGGELLRIHEAVEEVRSIDSCKWVEIHHATKRTRLVNRIRASARLCARPLIVLSWTTMPCPLYHTPLEASRSLKFPLSASRCIISHISCQYPLVGKGAHREDPTGHWARRRGRGLLCQAGYSMVHILANRRRLWGALPDVSGSAGRLSNTLVCGIKLSPS